MNTNNPTIHFEHRPASVPGRRATRKIVATATAGLLAVAVSATIIGNVGGAGPQPQPRVEPAVEHRAATEALVKRGVIPWQSLLPAAPANDPNLRDLVNRGLIPRQSLLPAAPANDPNLRDLVNRNLIPRQSLLPAGAPRPGT